jgi:hypothetical protein
MKKQQKQDATRVQASARTGLTSLIYNGNHGRQTHVFRKVAKLSGLSESGVRAFYNGTRPNMTCPNADRLLNAVNELLNGKG